MRGGRPTQSGRFRRQRRPVRRSCNADREFAWKTSLRVPVVLDLLEGVAGGRIVPVKVFETLPDLLGVLPFPLRAQLAGALERLTDRTPALLIGRGSFELRQIS